MTRPEDLTETERFQLCAGAGVPIDVESTPEESDDLRMTTRFPGSITQLRGGYVVDSAEARVPVRYRDL